MKRIAITLTFLLCSVSLAQAPAPKDGYVPNEKTAIKIAQAVLYGMQGESFLKSQQPFHAELTGDVWEVFGKWSAHPMCCGGGGVDMKINKQTGEIIGYYFQR